MNNINQEDIDNYINHLKLNINNKLSYIIDNYNILEKKNINYLSIEELFILKNSKQSFKFCPPERIDLYFNIILFYKSLEHFNISFDNYY